MTKAAALSQFWSSFGLNAYEENSVPSGDGRPNFPYITYQLATDSFGSEVSLSASLWYRATSLVNINAKTEEISKRIGRDGVYLPCDGGAIWIKRENTFATTMSDDSDDMIKKKYINITAEFLTAD